MKEIAHSQSFEIPDRIPLKLACRLFEVSLPTWYNWQKAGLINLYSIGSRTFIDRQEFYAAMQRKQPENNKILQQNGKI